jgi:hypothetical protein
VQVLLAHTARNMLRFADSIQPRARAFVSSMVNNASFAGEQTALRTGSASFTPTHRPARESQRSPARPRG